MCMYVLYSAYLTAYLTARTPRKEQAVSRYRVADPAGVGPAPLCFSASYLGCPATTPQNRVSPYASLGALLLQTAESLLRAKNSPVRPSAGRRCSWTTVVFRPYPACKAADRGSAKV